MGVGEDISREPFGGMSTGQPISVKCPKCMRGKYGKLRPIRGVQEMMSSSQREEWRATRRGKVMRILTYMTCRDCGHSWWTTLIAKRR
jgi:hypothetical protein